MPKHRIRKAGDDTRISKGKYASDINFDILEQRVDEDTNLNADDEFQDKTNEASSTVDSRTFDEIVMDAFDEFNSKSSRIRSNAITVICTQLQLSHNPAFLTKHIDRVLTIIKNGLQSNVAMEIDAAATLISLVAIQLLDSNIKMQVFYKQLKVLVKTALDNEHLKFWTRTAVCRAMGILTFVYETDGKKVRTVMQEFVEVFLPHPYYLPYAEDNLKIQTVNYEFHVAACETWTFLLTLLPSRSQCSRTSTYVLRNVEMIYAGLESPCFKMRVACAKAVAVVFECGSDDDKNYLKQYLPEIIKKISTIVDARNKHTSDIKSTPEVLQYLEKGIAPCHEIPSGKSALKLDNWALNVQYEMLCNVIGSANAVKHLRQNEKLLMKIRLARSTESSTLSPMLEEAVAYPAWEFIPSVPTQPKEYDVQNILKNFLNATNKSPAERTKALEEICKEVSLVPLAFLADQKHVILDIILKAIKRGGETEQLAAVRLATLTGLRLGRDDRFCSEMSNLFLNSLKNSSTSSSTTNASICTALAFFELVDNERANNVLFEHLMEVFRQKFSSNEESNLLRTKALDAWGLLLTLCSPKEVCSIIRSKMMKNLTEILLNANAELRIVCGHVIALIIEQGRLHDNNYLKSDIPEICNAITDVIDDRKNISRDERKMQNVKLREILKYLEDGCHSSFKLRFAEEVHELHTWSSLFKYQKLSQFIGANLATHLQQNERIRNIISIGAKPVTVPFQLKPNLQYKLSSAAKKKSRTKEIRLNFRTPKFECV